MAFLSSTRSLCTLALLAFSNTGAASLISAATLFSGPDAPDVDLGFAQYVGKLDSNTQSANYLGIKYANAPRFDHPQIMGGPKQTNRILAQDYGFTWPQPSVTSLFEGMDANIPESVTGLIESLPTFEKVVESQDEDCLMINVQRPQDTALTGLPVVLWIHGGSFEVGSSAGLLSETSGVNIFYQGSNLVKRSQEMNQPIIFTSINYRLAALGFLASQEMFDAGLLNLGLEDQRVAMQWIQNNIEKFGGDPTKVTIMGESAGAWSVSAHMVANGGNNDDLFRAAIGFSGGPVKVDKVSRSQHVFDSLTDFAGCSGNTDKIQCLRDQSPDVMTNFMNRNPFTLGYHSLATPWQIRPDGKNWTDSPDELFKSGKIANVPVFIGDLKDEGTLFSLVNSLNTKTTDDMKNYFRANFWPNITNSQLDQLLGEGGLLGTPGLYPDARPDLGSPFDTGIANNIAPQYKRISAITGDYSFESQRRQLLENAPGPKFNYLNEMGIPADNLTLWGLDSLAAPLVGKDDVNIPILGSFHTTDVPFNVFGTLPTSQTTLVMSTIISFINHLDPSFHTIDAPNVPKQWPQWDKDSKQTFVYKGLEGAVIAKDDYREVAIKWFNDNSDQLRV